MLQARRDHRLVLLFLVLPSLRFYQLLHCRQKVPLFQMVQVLLGYLLVPVSGREIAKERCKDSIHKLLSYRWARWSRLSVFSIRTILSLHTNKSICNSVCVESMNTNSISRSTRGARGSSWASWSLQPTGMGVLVYQKIRFGFT